MAELNPHIAYAIDATRAYGARWSPTVTGEGPRRAGHCVYCKGQCSGVTVECEMRVWEESTCKFKDSHLKR